jgi:hypothetical protein
MLTDGRRAELGAALIPSAVAVGAQLRLLAPLRIAARPDAGVQRPSRVQRAD